MGDVYVVPLGGGGITSDDVTATKDKILSGYTALTADSNDEPISGTMPNRESWSGNVAMNERVTVPQGYHNGTGVVSGPNITDRGAWGTSIGVNGSIAIPEGYHNGAGRITQSIPVQGGSTITPGTANKTAVAANRYVNGDIVVAGDSRLIPANIKAGTSIFGVAGSMVDYSYLVQGQVAF